MMPTNPIASAQPPQPEDDVPAVKRARRLVVGQFKANVELPAVGQDVQHEKQHKIHAAEHGGEQPGRLMAQQGGGGASKDPGEGIGPRRRWWSASSRSQRLGAGQRVMTRLRDGAGPSRRPRPIRIAQTPRPPDRPELRRAARTYARHAPVGDTTDSGRTKHTRDPPHRTSGEISDPRGKGGERHARANHQKQRPTIPQMDMK